MSDEWYEVKSDQSTKVTITYLQEEKKSTENGRTSNPALYANPDTNNKLPPLPRRCNSAQTARSVIM